MTTERTVRHNGQWVRITRDNKNRVFTLARGWNGALKAHHIEVWPEVALGTWEEAEELASKMIHHWK